ncbi:citramalate synthase [Desulfurispirillum indicum]|uniref:Citramalate synthase n=1 Tax=Desulfurispirillum indicum (strain ATCC BAA-1389 / DSM 22839 / S5) TaxID=653733 RepID=E6W625_DESIS|nr:citramalate synthase [Desulfurispirillum indicum]ADU64964.1 2-isopropylmalate synthase/homocitrate synthase family protein [Desulfurispirillum indicum S5]UCZ56900.1 citramalate synthase [Desulfurispirillum indicum]
MDVKLYDTTLRDGTQSEDISFTVEDKLHVAQLLDDFGIHYIEGGWPGSNPKDIEFFHAVKKLNLKNARISAFGSTRRAKLTCEEDPNIQALLESQAPVACIFGKTWDFHVTTALQISLEQNLEIIEDSLAYLKKNVEEVFYDAEHFFDGYKANPEYAIKTLLAAQRGGAETIVLCDTNGGTLPFELGAIIEEVKKHISVPLGIHCHNDSELAVANSITAVKHGITQVQGTINGFGERCGNANLISIIPNLKLKMGLDCVSDQGLRKLNHLSHSVRELANLGEWKNQPYTGKSAFAHKGGIHVSAILKNPETYEHIAPEVVGNKRRVLVSDLSGRSNIQYKIEEMGLDIDMNDPSVQEVVQKIKDLENQGYAYEGAEASMELLLQKSRGNLPEYFKLRGYRVVDERREQDAEPISEATVRLEAPNNEVYHTAAMGDGPVDALNSALRKALIQFYPILDEVTLVDYKVRILNTTVGTKAKTRVLIESTDGKSTWSTVGVHCDIIRASYLALVDSIRYKLYKEKI